MKIRMRKRLSAPGLLEAIRIRFGRINDPLQSKTQFTLQDCLMSGLAMFSLKFRSLLQFDNSCEHPNIQKNLKNLYGVENIPSDTYMRERLDTIDPKYFKRSFKACFSALQQGKVLPLYNFLDNYYLISNDGTGFFHSHDIKCDNCCKKNHRDGKVSYYHNMLTTVMVSPEQKTVFPMAIEPILKQDGNTKNDCELNASKRILAKLRTMHPNLKMVIVEDALYGNAPHINLLKELDYKYIIGVKPSDHEWLFDYVNAAKTSTVEIKRDKKTYTLSWVNDAPLNSSNEEVRVNFIKCEEISPKGKKQTFTWITNFKITRDNIFILMKGGRARWKIENETFNTLKTQGYNFEHNYGHGYKNLSTVMANLMMLAFLIDQIQQTCCPIFQKALAKCLKKIRLWERMRSWFLTFIIDSWDTFFHAISDPPNITLAPDTG